jgi:hypothetical protein
MKHKHIILFALLLFTASLSAQIQFTAGVNYESGVPSGAHSSTGSRIRADLSTGRLYLWSPSASTWRLMGQGIDITSGCVAPAYTPAYGQSTFAVNGCNELYVYASGSCGLKYQVAVAVAALITQAKALTLTTMIPSVLTP